MSIVHVTDFNGKVRVAVNPGERRPPYLSNLVPGDMCRQETPNGVSTGAEGCFFGPQGSRATKPQDGPVCGGEALTGYRTGE